MTVNQNTFIQLMLSACEKNSLPQWGTIKPHAEHEFIGLLIMLDWTSKMKAQERMTTEEARIHIDIQKNTMRTRLMALPATTMVDAEHIINTAIDSIRHKLYEQMDWVII